MYIKYYTSSNVQSPKTLISVPSILPCNNKYNIFYKRVHTHIHICICLYNSVNS